MDTFTALSVIALAAPIHASFQLGVSTITLLSSHGAGKKVAAGKILRLVGSFLAGTITVTTFLVFALLYFTTTLELWQKPNSLWTAISGALAALGIAVWIFYYRRGTGTPLWIPRAFARFLTARVRSTSLSVEAFSLGLTTVIAELPFMITPMITATLALAFLPADLQVLGAFGYVAVASLGIIVVAVLIGGGHNISHIQRWREANKHFLQFAAGTGLVVLAFYLYVNQVVAVAAAGAGIQ